MHCHSTQRRRRRHRIVLHCHGASLMTGAGYTPGYIGPGSERTCSRAKISRPFRFIRARARARQHGLGAGCRNSEAKPTDVTRSSARIARGEDGTRLWLSCRFSLTPIPFPSCSPFSLDRNIRFPLSRPFASNPRPCCRFALLIDSRRFNRCLITLQVDRGV